MSENLYQGKGKFFDGYPLVMGGLRRVNEDLWFVIHQKLLLKMANTVEGRALLDIPKDYRNIVRFAKNEVRCQLSRPFLDKKGRLVAHFHSDFRIGAKWANVIRYRWQEVCDYADKLAWEEWMAQGRHLGWRSVVGECVTVGGRKMFASLTVYPDPSTGAASVDGYTQRYTPSGETWSSMDSGAGTHAYPSATSGNLLLLQTTGSSTWQYLVKSGFVFVTSSMGAGSTVTAAVLSSWLTNVRDGLNLANNNGFSSRVYSFSPAADNDIVASDHGNFGTTGWSNTVAYASHSAGGYNNWTLNATGLGNVSVTGNTKVGIRNTQYDVGAVTPDPVAGENTGFVAYFADQTGTGNDPKLVVTYTAPAPPSDPAIVSMSWGVTI